MVSAKVSQIDFCKRYKSIFDFASDKATDTVKNAIRKNTVELDKIFNISFGLKTGDDKVFLSLVASTPEHRRLIRGEDISTYLIIYKGEYVWYVPKVMREHRKTARPGESTRFEQPKALIRDTGSGLMATFDDDNYYSKDVLIVSSQDQSASALKKLVAILNSRMMKYYYETSFPTLHVQRDELASLPLHCEAFGQGIYDELPLFVDQILTAKKADPKADTSALEAEIDRLVYQLYGLTDAEIAVVEGRNQ